MNSDCVIVDANIAFKCLCSNRGDFRDRFRRGDQRFFCPRFLYVELFKHKDRLAVASNLTESQLLEALYSLVSHLDFINEANIPIGTWVEAFRLCKDVDPKDTPYVALTLHMDGLLWTDDQELKLKLPPRGFSRFFEP